MPFALLARQTITLWLLGPVSGDLMWSNKKENEFFSLQEHASTRSTFYGVVASLIANPHPYRILLKANERVKLIPLPALVAMAETLRAIEEHWNFLEENLIPACSLFDCTVPDEEKELWQFLISKLRSLADLDKEQHEKRIEQKRIKEKTERVKSVVMDSGQAIDARHRQKQLAIKKREQNVAARRRNWEKLFPTAANHSLIHGMNQG